MLRLYTSHIGTVSLPEGRRFGLRSGTDLLSVISNKCVNVYIYMLRTITCLSIFKVVNLSHRYVLSYVNVLKYLPGTYFMERLINAKLTADRSILMRAL